METRIEILEIMLTPDHNWGAEDYERQRMNKVDAVECVAGKGLKGDRYFDHKEDFLGQVTFIDNATVDAVIEHTGKADLDPSVLRRNILVKGADLNSLIGKRFSIAGIEFSGSEECSPCQWMNIVAGEGSERVMKDRGGLRCRILSSGTIEKGEAKLVVLS